MVQILMNDLGQSLSQNIDLIVERWVEAVHWDGKIGSAKKLAHEAVRDSIPDVLAELARLLSQQSEDSQELEEKSLSHGFVRAEQGYDTTEIVREYRLLRTTILETLDEDFRKSSVEEVLNTIQVIDRILDEIIACSMDSYIEARLHELQQMQAQLMLTNQELTRLIQVHKENLAYLAHELKTPLNSIIGFSDLLLREQRKQFKLEGQATPANLDHVERVLRNGQQLLKIINDALEISRYDQGQIQLNLNKVNVGYLVQEIVEEGLRPQAEAKGLELFVNVEFAPQHILTDSLRIQQLVNNLVSNAIKYTKSGEIRVTCQQLNQQEWSIIVADTGIGISKENQANIFESYFQIEPSEQPLQSVGLGLAIVSRIVKLFNGEVQLESTLGKGSVFTIKLPCLID